MPRKSLDELGRLQTAIMEAIWDMGEATVQQVLDQLSRKKKLAYTTVLSALQKLEKAGWVKHCQQGRTYVYRPKHSRGEEGKRSVRKLLERVFAGDALSMFQHLLDDQDLSPEELAEFTKVIDERREGEQR